MGREKETELKQGGQGTGKRTPMRAVTATLMNGEKLCDSYFVYYTLCIYMLLYMYVCIVLLVISSKLCVHASVCICMCV